MPDFTSSAVAPDSAACSWAHEARDTRERGTGHSRVRLHQRMLMMTPVVAPVPTAVAFVVKGLLSQIDADEVVVAAERWPANPVGQTHEPNGHRVHFVGRSWTWPKRGQRYVHWMKWLFVPGMAYRLVKLARSKQCGAIFGHFPDEKCLCAAYLAARTLGLRFFPFFHNTYRENRSGAAYLFATWLQGQAFKRAGVVFVMSDGMKEEWQSRYPGVEFHSLVHTFDGPVPTFQPLPAVDCAGIRLGCLGLVSEANLDALRRICQVVNASHDLKLNIYSGTAPRHLQAQGLLGERTRHEQPSDDNLQESLRSNDILLLPHGLTGGLAPIEYQTIFPTRTIPYLLSGRPILAHSAPNSFLSCWLRKHDCAELVEDPDPTALRAAIDRLCQDPIRREQLVRNALLAAEQFRAERVVDDMKRIINRCNEPAPTLQPTSAND